MCGLKGLNPQFHMSKEDLLHQPLLLFHPEDFAYRSATD